MDELTIFEKKILNKSEADIRTSCEEQISRDIQQPGNVETRIQNTTQWSEEPATSAKKVRKDFVPLQAMKAYEEAMAVTSTLDRFDELHVPTALAPGKKHPLPSSGTLVIYLSIYTVYNHSLTDKAVGTRNMDTAPDQRRSTTVRHAARYVTKIVSSAVVNREPDET
jgi:hypothetical protein